MGARGPKAPSWKAGWGRTACLSERGQASEGLERTFRAAQRLAVRGNSGAGQLCLSGKTPCLCLCLPYNGEVSGP